MKTRRLFVTLMSVLCIFALCFTGCAENNGGQPAPSGTEESGTSTAEFAGGNGTAEDPWQVATAEQLDMMRDSLDEHYVLVDDIDLSALSEWEPIGVYQPISGDEHDSPDLELAFTGTFDGAGYTLSNLSISQPEAMSVGLFGCVAGEDASIVDLTLEDITVTGGNLVAGLIGYAGASYTVENVKLVGDNTITGGAMTGGIVGGGLCNLKDCESEANIVYTEEDVDSGGGAGILAGGMEGGSIENCMATGTLTSTGNGGFFGGLVACAFDSPSITGCTVEVTMQVSEDAKMIGGIAGHAGTFESESPTLISDCKVDAKITAPESAQRIGGIVGSGFYASGAVPSPALFKVVDCHTSGSIMGGTIAGTIAGYLYTGSSVENCTSDMTINDAQESPQIGADNQTVSLDQFG